MAQGLWSAKMSRQPHPRVQPTPLCGDKIGGILKATFGLKHASIYRCAAADAPSVRQPMREDVHLICGIEHCSLALIEIYGGN